MFKIEGGTPAECKLCNIFLNPRVVAVSLFLEPGSDPVDNLLSDTSAVFARFRMELVIESFVQLSQHTIIYVRNEIENSFSDHCTYQKLSRKLRRILRHICPLHDNNHLLLIKMSILKRHFSPDASIYRFLICTFLELAEK